MKDLDRDRPASPLREPKPLISRRERNKQDKLQRIRRAAAELFHERGFERTTTQAIAERADIGSGTLFLYARTKEDLLALVMGNDVKDTAHKACAGIPADLPLSGQAYHVFSRLIRYHARNHALSRYYVRERTIPRHIKHDHGHDEVPPAPDIVNHMTAVIERAQQAGQVDDQYSAAAISWSLFALYYGALIGLLVGRNSERKALAELQRGFDMLSRGIRRGGTNGA
jgi:AcrR family transcriptional regulator